MQLPCIRIKVGGHFGMMWVLILKGLILPPTVPTAKLPEDLQETQSLQDSSQRTCSYLLVPVGDPVPPVVMYKNSAPIHCPQNIVFKVAKLEKGFDTIA